MQKIRMKHYLRTLLSIMLLFAFDQLTKVLAVTYLKDQPSLPLIKDIFELQYLENCGAAFGILQNRQTYFIICVVVMTVVLFYFFLKVPMTRLYFPLRICAILILSGAFGNCYDRLVHKYVVDFFYFKLINFPIFNVADIYVTCATIILIFLLLFYYKEEDLDRIFKGSKR